MKKDVGQKLQNLRHENKITQEQMGEKLNLSTSAYCKIEYGETDITLTRLNEIAQIFNISAVELLIKLTCDAGGGFGGAEYHIADHAADDLLVSVKANSRLIEMLFKRISELEAVVKEHSAH